MLSDERLTELTNSDIPQVIVLQLSEAAVGHIRLLLRSMYVQHQ